MMGNINKYLSMKLSALMTSSDLGGYKALTKRAEALSTIGIDSNEKFIKYLFLKKASRNLGLSVESFDISKLLSYNIKNINDAYYYLLKNRIKGTMKKVAYPNFDPNIYDRIEDEFDLNKWLDVTHLVFDAVSKNEMTKENALDYYSNFLDIERDEDLNFKKWFEYYSKGEHLKYSSEENKQMKKKALYTADLGQGNNPYYGGSGSSYLNRSTGFNMPGDSFGESLFGEESEEEQTEGSSEGCGAGSGDEFSGWKRKLHSACRRIDRLIRNDKFLNSEDYKALAELLLNLSLQVQMLKLASTASDVTHRAANKLNKMGYLGEASILKKIAQEVPANPPVAEEQVAQDPAFANAAPVVPGMPAGAPAEEPPRAPTIKDMIPNPGDVDAASLKDIVPIPGARPGEYEELAGEVNVEDAATKLDEIAGMLSDRRIIRRLAEFDIMLDKIGIASMFPELAESQSKLIDSFSYALTRVTKMMGQLSNAKTVIEAQPNFVPGAVQAPEQEAPEQEAPEQGQGFPPAI